MCAYSPPSSGASPRSSEMGGPNCILTKTKVKSHIYPHGFLRCFRWPNPNLPLFASAPRVADVPKQAPHATGRRGRGEVDGEAKAKGLCPLSPAAKAGRSGSGTGSSISARKLRAQGLAAGGPRRQRVVSPAHACRARAERGSAPGLQLRAPRRQKRDTRVTLSRPSARCVVAV